jgi:hypothetical protein
LAFSFVKGPILMGTWCWKKFALELKYDTCHTQTTVVTQISWWVVQEIACRNGRFLVEGSHRFWVDLTNKDVAREKVSNAFRDLHSINVSGGKKNGTTVSVAAKSTKIENDWMGQPLTQH